jgi:hypothetical protein
MKEKIEAVVEGAVTAVGVLLVVALLLMLTGCDPVVEQRQIGPAETRRYETTEMGPGFCTTCMPGMDGKMTCGFKYSNFCPHPATRDGTFVPLERKHKSGLVDTLWSGPR